MVPATCIGLSEGLEQVRIGGTDIRQGQEGADAQYFTRVREEYNEIRDPVLLYYLVARCVKNAVRFSKDGRFTQSADKRRKGMSPDKVERNVKAASALLRGRAEFFAGDYHRPTDVVKPDLELGGAAEDVGMLVALGKWFADPRRVPLDRAEAAGR